jgi:hypothetical protein
MNLFKKIKITTAGFLLAYVSSASAHIGYTGRDFGSFAGNGSDPSKLIASNTVTGDVGWASGTDANLGDSHKTRAFRFSLLGTGLVTLEIQGLDIIRSGVPVSALANPGFSIYKGLAHISPALGDHDGSFISTLYNDFTYGAGNWEGSFNALGDWKIGNDDGQTFADLSSFAYVGNAADGSYANFGSAAGIRGDGVTDGYVKGSFILGPGEYSVFVGGGNYSGVSTASFAFNATLSVIPEPSIYGLLGIGIAVLIMAYRRRTSVR